MNMLEKFEKTLEAKCEEQKNNCKSCPHKNTCNDYLETVWASDYITKLAQESPADDKYKYMMLSRHKADCEYYLGYGHRSNNALWAKNPKEHIANMKLLWFSFETKPEWLTMEQINEYKEKMM